MKKIILAALIIFVSACKKDSSPITTPPPTPTVPVLPTLSTTPVSGATRTAAISGGNILNDGGASISSRGLCYSSSSNPTIANNIVTNGSGTGSFTSNLTNLTANTQYFIKAFATNSVGTAYGNEISFTTQPISTPTVATTPTVTIVTPFATTTSSNISDDGGSPVTARGVCWSSSNPPTIADNKTNDGTGTGNFTSAIINLLGNTTYYIRVYATNAIGTSYGQQVTIVTDIDGNIYNTIPIGTQTWILENLKTTKLNDGTVIPFVTANNVWSIFGPANTQMYCWYNNDVNNKNIFGAIYNFLAVKTGKLAPNGWHIPSLSELNILIHYLDPLAGDSIEQNSLGTQFVVTHSLNAGSSLKEIGNNHWILPNNASNSSGFTALPGGWRQDLDGSFAYLGSNAGFWTSTIYDPSSNINYYLILFNQGAYCNTSWNGERQGFSIRCLKN